MTQLVRDLKEELTPGVTNLRCTVVRTTLAGRNPPILCEVEGLTCFGHGISNIREDLRKGGRRKMSLGKLALLYLSFSIAITGGDPNIAKASIGADIIGAGSALTFDLGLKPEKDRAPFELSFLLHFERLEESATPAIQVEITGGGAQKLSADYTLINDSPFSPPAFHLDDSFGGRSISFIIRNGDIPVRMNEIIVDFENTNGHPIKRNFAPVASVISTPPSVTLALTALVCCFAVFRVARRRSTYGAAV